MMQSIVLSRELTQRESQTAVQLLLAAAELLLMLVL
jgi:hypothetical protein